MWLHDSRLMQVNFMVWFLLAKNLKYQHSSWYKLIKLKLKYDQHSSKHKLGKLKYQQSFSILIDDESNLISIGTRILGMKNS